MVPASAADAEGSGRPGADDDNNDHDDDAASRRDHLSRRVAPAARDRRAVSVLERSSSQDTAS